MASDMLGQKLKTWKPGILTSVGALDKQTIKVWSRAYSRHSPAPLACRECTVFGPFLHPGSAPTEVPISSRQTSPTVRHVDSNAVIGLQLHIYLIDIKNTSLFMRNAVSR